MDLLAQHEAFLRAIFDTPDDDTPRLVYADFLQENGDEERAEFIRVSCEHKRLLNYDRGVPERNRLWEVIDQQVEIQRRLAENRPLEFSAFVTYDRGFPTGYVREPYLLSVEELGFPSSLRERCVFRVPKTFAVEVVQLHGPRIVDAAPFNTFFALAAFARVRELVLHGSRQEVVRAYGLDCDTEFVLKPIINTAGVSALAQHRGMARIQRLNLTNNDLDNDAARALVASPYLDNLKRLQLLEGNRLRGKVWQQVIERFGEDVVG